MDRGNKEASENKEDEGQNQTNQSANTLNI